MEGCKESEWKSERDCQTLWGKQGLEGVLWHLLTQRGTGNVGNVGGNAELHRKGAAHNTTKPKTRVGQDLLACPLTISPNYWDQKDYLDILMGRYKNPVLNPFHFPLRQLLPNLPLLPQLLPNLPLLLFTQLLLLLTNGFSMINLQEVISPLTVPMWQP